MPIFKRSRRCLKSPNRGIADPIEPARIGEVGRGAERSEVVGARMFATCTGRVFYLDVIEAQKQWPKATNNPTVTLNQLAIYFERKLTP